MNLVKKRHDFGVMSMFLAMLFLTMALFLKETLSGVIFISSSFVMIIFSGYELGIFEEIKKVN